MAPAKAFELPAPSPKAATNAADAGAAAPTDVRVPALRGRTLAAADRLLRARGLTLAPGCPPTSGMVTGQRPAAGSRVARGTQVTARTASCIAFSSP
jgi:beta-lactam-binding protein with PASTA domain